MELQLRNAKFQRNPHDHPFISIEVNGIAAHIPAEQKAFGDGLLFLGAQFEDQLPICYLPADPDNGRPRRQALYGFTRDPRLLALYAQFREEINAPNYTPRAVEIPNP